jgi:hypothetical protein
MQLRAGILGKGDRYVTKGGSWTASGGAVKRDVSLEQRQCVDGKTGGRVDSVLWNERAASESGPFPRTLNFGITFDLDSWYRNA